MASNTLILGLQWGDEGKGKIVDELSEEATETQYFVLQKFAYSSSNCLTFSPNIYHPES